MPDAPRGGNRCVLCISVKNALSRRHFYWQAYVSLDNGDLNTHNMYFVSRITIGGVCFTGKKTLNDGPLITRNRDPLGWYIYINICTCVLRKRWEKKKQYFLIPAARRRRLPRVNLHNKTTVSKEFRISIYGRACCMVHLVSSSQSKHPIYKRIQRFTPYDLCEIHAYYIYIGCSVCSRIYMKVWRWINRWRRYFVYRNVCATAYTQIGIKGCAIF